MAAAYVHFRLLSDPLYVSVCDVSATVTCTQVYASRYGTLAGISVAVLGAIWFAFAALLAVAAVRENVPGYLFASSTPALAVVLYLGYASFFVLELVCIFCVITYVAVIGLFLVAGASTSVPMKSLPGRAIRDLKLLATSPVAVTLALLLVVGAGSTLAYFPREGGAGTTPSPQVVGEPRSELQRLMAEAPRTPLDIPTDGAAVLIVKFNDY